MCQQIIKIGIPTKIKDVDIPKKINVNIPQNKDVNIPQNKDGNIPSNNNNQSSVHVTVSRNKVSN